VAAKNEAVLTTQAAAAEVNETMGDSKRWREEFKACGEELRACWRSCGGNPLP
jgi:hypothetical protein